jgi:hypothetical protein
MEGPLSRPALAKIQDPISKSTEKTKELGVWLKW